ncbi:hypothetical protein [Amycolatopsis sp. WQ 127309]|uniref:hypothetical protein n=1 Tax=Amycolatopsis sp. WQ 127309 TaxID=2932773 RepID=UPI001FF1AF4D|nr:hypothetical protein [Amycolatopsis sp. WQ 127309]UOZ10535.1 hypothetical protein MUY22_20630 [Amycolatopsis sp. WQ 127309]
MNWPEWTAITTPWNDPGGDDPDEYHVECFRCRDAQRSPYQADGTRDECVEWTQPHFDDPEPEAP